MGVQASCRRRTLANGVFTEVSTNPLPVCTLILLRPEFLAPEMYLSELLHYKRTVPVT